MGLGRLMPLLVVTLGCRGSSGKPAPSPGPAGDARAAAAEPAIAEAPSLVLGVPALADYGYRTGPGEPAFARARQAESAGRWAEVAAACSEALASDPGHLGASYLLAVARAKLDVPAAEIVAPLSAAIGGDFAYWGTAGLAQPALQGFFATPLGISLKMRVDEARTRYAAALAHSLLVTVHGDLYALETDHARWHRLTRTGGGVVATFAVAGIDTLVYVTRRKPAGKPATVGIGTIDRATGVVKRPIALPAAAASSTIRIGYNQKKLGAFVVRAGSWYALAVGPQGTLSLRALPATPPPGAPTYLAESAWLDVTGRHARLTRLSLPKVAADWDEHSLASAIRIGSSGRVVQVPSPGLVDGNTAVWSPDQTQLAFVAQLDDTCAPGTPTMAAYVADAATGSTRELERAIEGIAIQWLAARQLAVAGDHGVAVYELPSGTPTPLAGVDGLAMQRRQPRCVKVAPPVDEAATPDEPEL